MDSARQRKLDEAREARDQRESMKFVVDDPADDSIDDALFDVDADDTHRRHGKPADPNRGARRRKWLKRLAITFVVLLIAAELTARYWVGLGDPPLMMTDAKIEYLYQPNQTCHRFHNLIHYNQWSMRSDDFPEYKRSKDEVRILVIGDSVINGGSQTDQSQLATSLLQQELSAQLGRPVTIGNISAGSWGTPNEWAYLQKFRLFEADLVVIVVSSHDVADVPTFAPSVGVLPSMPDRRPMSALVELVTRYAWPMVHQSFSSHAQAQQPATASTSGDAPPADDPNAPLDPKQVEQCVEALRGMIRMTRAAGASVIVAQHETRREVETNKPDPGQAILRDAAQAEKADSIFSMKRGFADAVEHGENPFRDSIHPNARGQRAMADVLKPAIVDVLKARGPVPAPTATPGTTRPSAVTSPATSPAAAPTTAPTR